MEYNKVRYQVLMKQNGSLSKVQIMFYLRKVFVLRSTLLYTTVRFA